MKPHSSRTVCSEDGSHTTAKEVTLWSDPMKRPGWDKRRASLSNWGWGTLAAGGLLATAGLAGAAPSPVTMDGVPEQVHPQVSEVGLGSFSMPTGTTSIMPGSGTGATGSGSGTGTDAASLSGAAYDTMMSQSWGAQASSYATALGVNSTAVAATCVVESGCTNNESSGDIRGIFQMTSAAYTSNLAAALASDPNLAANVTSGLAGQNDPATQSIAAAQYLKSAAQDLQNAGIANPTVLDVRGSYNFGPTNGTAIAQANGDALMSSVIRGLSSSTLAANGITSTTTVQQWKDSVSAKIGSAAGQPVLLGA